MKIIVGVIMILVSFVFLYYGIKTDKLWKSFVGGCISAIGIMLMII